MKPRIDTRRWVIAAILLGAAFALIRSDYPIFNTNAEVIARHAGEALSGAVLFGLAAAAICMYLNRGRRIP